MTKNHYCYVYVCMPYPWTNMWSLSPIKWCTLELCHRFHQIWSALNLHLTEYSVQCTVQSTVQLCYTFCLSVTARAATIIASLPYCGIRGVPWCWARATILMKLDYSVSVALSTCIQTFLKTHFFFSISHTGIEKDDIHSTRFFFLNLSTREWENDSKTPRSLH